MIKLKSLYKEIKVVKPVKPQEVLKLWNEVKNMDNNLKFWEGLKIFNKYNADSSQGLSVWIPTLSPSILFNLYQDLLNLKNS